MSFMTIEQKKPVFETVNYFEKITKGHETRILQHDCGNQTCIGKEPRIASVQLKYHAYKENSVIKISIGDDYHKKVMKILESLKRKQILLFSLNSLFLLMILKRYRDSQMKTGF